MDLQLSFSRGVVEQAFLGPNPMSLFPHRNLFSSRFLSKHNVVTLKRPVCYFASEPQVECESVVAPSKTIKRKVAMWIGYVGTYYKGLQIQRTTAAGQTIEQELETAIFNAGGILESNFGSLEKIKWMRSSRTDKGVHSLSTVISFKMEMEQRAAGSDQEGLEFASKINQYLPNTIRVFGIDPVTKSFDPRRDCCHRTYFYLLPAATIGIAQDSDREEVQQRISTFRALLSSFEGRFPYHNYTVRSQYRKKVAHPKHTEESKSVLDGLSSEDSSDDESDSQRTILNTDASLLVDTSSNENELKNMSSFPKIRWLYEVNVADKISSAHFRNIYSFTCDELQEYEGLRFLKLIIHGESFMLHQIRKMIATAVAVMVGVLPSDIIPMSLARSCRVVLPIAPSDGLLLAGNEFSPFRGGSPLPKGTKDFKDLPRLKMSKQILERKEEFWRNILLPHMVSLLRDNDDVWKSWLEKLEWARVSEVELSCVRNAWVDYMKFCENQRNLRAGVQINASFED